jgi:hypothetical protein
MPVESGEKLEIARKLMDGFALRTGLSDRGNTKERYLWTDAFAVQTFFALGHAFNTESYHRLALQLIGEVHQVLGRFHPADTRKGWISGLLEEQGQRHPTARRLKNWEKDGGKKI